MKFEDGKEKEDTVGGIYSVSTGHSETCNRGVSGCEMEKKKREKGGSRIESGANQAGRTY